MIGSNTNAAAQIFSCPFLIASHSTIVRFNARQTELKNWRNDSANRSSISRIMNRTDLSEASILLSTWKSWDNSIPDGHVSNLLYHIFLLSWDLLCRSIVMSTTELTPYFGNLFKFFQCLPEPCYVQDLLESEKNSLSLSGRHTR